MGRMTSSAIQSSYQAEHRGILDTLNGLAEKFLTAVRRKHGSARQEYLSELIQLIRNRLNVRGVSIFYQLPFENKVECLATTGLYDVEKRVAVQKIDLSEVQYAENEGFTGRCFKSGKQLLRVRSANDGHVAKFRELSNGKPIQYAGSCFQPIPIPIYQDACKSDGAHGVIRCTDPYSPMLNRRSRSFGQTELKKLSFIARQVAPVLHTFAVRVQRELTISIVKHDLETPLNMIRDTSEDIETYVDQDGRVKWHDLMNLKTSALFAQSLLEQLDPDPFEIPKLVIEETLLEGDIVGRLKHMLDHYAAEENGMTIRYRGFSGVYDNIPALYLDQAQIERVFWNLLVNAIKYGREDSEIKVIAKKVDGGFSVDISNVGIGIEETDSKRVFRPNFRADEARQLKQGLGLGLSIAKKAIEKHGGKLELTRRKNPTVFTIFFPEFLTKENWNNET